MNAQARHSGPRTLVVGGGIGGLSTAIALARIGVPVEVAEQAPRLEPVGAGITMQANATAVLRALGVRLPEEDVVPIGRFEMVNAAGRVMMQGDAGAIRIDPPSVNIHRADLHRALHAACGAAPVHLDRRLSTLDADEDGVTVGFSDGSTGRYDLVVGADGAGSTVRRLLLGEEAARLRYSGQTCWRFAIEAPDLVPDLTVERWNPGRRSGIVPLSRGRMYVYLVLSAPPDTARPGSNHPEVIRERFGGFDARLDPILERLDGSVPVHHGDLCEQPRISFGRGRVLLLGDASHAMTPNLGQGAGTAVEDAATLSILLAEGRTPIPELSSALERLRRERVAAVQRMSWRIGQMAHLENPVLRWLRDRLLAAMPAAASGKQAAALWAPGIALAEAIPATG